MNSTYTASDIEVLEGLEGIRRRPGMYIGGTDSRALHHLVAEVLDNAMDEAVAGHADRIWIALNKEGSVTVRDNGRGIPVDPHPRYPDKSALEIILTTLHSGGKFHNKAYATAGGLHGVGISVVNALSVTTDIVVDRDGFRWRQRFSRGLAAGPLEKLDPVRRRGTEVTFLPDPEIFPSTAFVPAQILEMARSKAFLNKGVMIRVRVEESGEEQEFHFPNGLADYLKFAVPLEERVIPEVFEGNEPRFGASRQGRLEWAMVWIVSGDGRLLSYCNTIPTPAGGTHEAGLRSSLVKGVREYAESRGLLPKGLTIIADDILDGMVGLLSLFIPNPQFSGQTKERVANAELTAQVEAAIKDHLDHWLNARTEQANRLIEAVVERARIRIERRSAAPKVKRQSATTRLTLPGKLTDCVATDTAISELFIVEGDSAGGSAKQARNRHNQAILPLRGKILNVEQANLEKMEKNSEIQNLVTAIGTGIGRAFNIDGLRYGRVIIMTDADVDGAHIASLLLTFFFRFMPVLVQKGHIYLAQPPLFRLTVGSTSHYVLDEAEKERMLAKLARKKVEISRFKGLGEMDPQQLRETTMDPKTRRLLRVFVDDDRLTQVTFERLMGKRPAERFRFIQEKAHFAVANLDI